MRCLLGCLCAQCRATLHPTSEQQHIALKFVSEKDDNFVGLLGVYEGQDNTMFKVMVFNTSMIHFSSRKYRQYIGRIAKQKTIYTIDNMNTPLNLVIMCIHDAGLTFITEYGMKTTCIPLNTEQNMECHNPTCDRTKIKVKNIPFKLRENKNTTT